MPFPVGYSFDRAVWRDTAPQTPTGCLDTRHGRGDSEGDSQTRPGAEGRRLPDSAAAGDANRRRGCGLLGYFAAVPYLNEWNASAAACRTRSVGSELGRPVISRRSAEHHRAAGVLSRRQDIGRCRTCGDRAGRCGTGPRSPGRRSPARAPRIAAGTVELGPQRLDVPRRVSREQRRGRRRRSYAGSASGLTVTAAVIRPRRPSSRAARPAAGRPCAARRCRTGR